MLEALIGLRNSGDGAYLMLASFILMLFFCFTTRAFCKKSRLDDDTINIILFAAGMIGLFLLPGLCRLAEYLL